MIKDKEKKKAYDKAWVEKNRAYKNQYEKERYCKKGKEEKQLHYQAKGKWAQIKKKYNLTKEEYEAKVASQPVCPICKKGFTEDNSPFIDHNHETGKVRALLHSICNLLVGAIENDIHHVDNVLSYLKEHV